MAQLIDGKAISAAVREEIREDCEKLVRETGVRPGLAVIIVGEDPASQIYVRNKEKACQEVGFLSRTYRLAADTKQEQLEELIDELNRDKEIHGILVQLPLPDHLDGNALLLRIKPEKDVDAFHPFNVGQIMIGNYDLAPCTPAGVMVLLEKSGISVAGKRCVVVGRSNIVGKPQAMLLLHANGTVTIAHSKTKDLADLTRQAQVLVVAVRHPKLITGNMVSEGVVVIDVGMNRDEAGKLCGDVDFDSVAPKASYITPVPGGVGPMTITMLMKNTLTAARRAAKEI
ncbi:MAG: bifunctional methylenetetrahydrofolate dehydrogenase/methenyltetrahydrofolate cyclohydrolase FolD [Clostridia bacterium]|nr:bifunctional methylenetetrahydrofolate dehydrogenase/methenyltetrahydrofolate cyclohydrolase FolD [Clostridia bacterium]